MARWKTPPLLNAADVGNLSAIKNLPKHLGVTISILGCASDGNNRQRKARD